MTKIDWSLVKREDVLKAIRDFLEDNTACPSPRNTFLLYDGKKLPAKHIRGMAYKIATGTEILKLDYSGGMETVRFFQKLGFETLYLTNDSQKSALVAHPGKFLREKNVKLKIGMYLQTDSFSNLKEFRKVIALVRDSDLDIVVFPEFSWTPFTSMIWKSDCTKERDITAIFEHCLKLSKETGTAVVLGNEDKYGRIFSVFANAAAGESETETAVYVKHTMTNYSAFEFEDYRSLSSTFFTPIDFRGYRIGLTICYDCNHALFSRMYGVQGVDVILNSTGGNVKYDKWFKYNQVRAIENRCFTLCTMGGDDKKNQNSYVYGFNRNGKALEFTSLNSTKTENNVPGGIYKFDLSKDDNGFQVDSSINQTWTVNKKQDLFLPVGDMQEILRLSKQLEENLYIYCADERNIVIIVADHKDIYRPEEILPHMYSDKLMSYGNKRYLILCRYEELSNDEYQMMLSQVMKVRAMENFCAVILESNLVNVCYQTGFTRAAQVVQSENGYFGLDTSRMSGPEAIWKNKQGMKAVWRDNFAWLTGECKRLAVQKGNTYGI